MLLLGAEQSGFKPLKYLSIFLSACTQVNTIIIHMLQLKCMEKSGMLRLNPPEKHS